MSIDSMRARVRGAAWTAGGMTRDVPVRRGFIDEFGFWKRVLNSGEATELYNHGDGVDYAYISGGAAPTLADHTLFFAQAF